MHISRELALQILEYLDQHPRFYFPFLVMCREYSDEDEDFVEIESDEWEMMNNDDKYQTFELWENLQNLDKETLRLMAVGFISKVTGDSVQDRIAQLAKSYRRVWKKKLWESARIEEFGLNEFFGGKAEGFEESLKILKDNHI